MSEMSPLQKAGAYLRRLFSRTSEASGNDPPRTPLEQWASSAGVEERLTHYGATRLQQANTVLERLSTAKNKEEMQWLLAFRRSKQEPLLDPRDPKVYAQLQLLQQENEVLAFALIREALNTLRAPVAPAAPPPAIGWLQLVARYCPESELLRAHGRFLEGAAWSVVAMFPQALVPLREALEIYEQLNAPPGLQSVCAYELARATAVTRGMPDALPFFTRAQTLVDGPGESLQSWREFVTTEQARWVERDQLMNGLLAASAAEPVGPPPEGGPPADDLVWHALQTRAQQQVLNGNIQEAVASATAADRVAAGLGRASDFRKTLAQDTDFLKKSSVAEALLRAWLREKPGDLDARVMLARLASEQGRLDEAEASLMKVLEVAPAHAGAHGELGALYFVRDRPEEALMHVAIAVELDPKDTRLAQRLTLFLPPDPDGVQIDPRTGELYIPPHLILLRFEDPEQLSAVITAGLLRAKPRDIALMLPVIEHEKGFDFTERVRNRLFPWRARGEPDDHFRKAETLFGMCRYREAMAEYKHAISTEPNHGRAYMGIGDCHYHLGEFNLATAFFEESLAIEPNASTYRFLGDAHRKCGRREQAIEAYQQAIQLKPDYEMARRQLEVMLQDGSGGQHGA